MVHRVPPKATPNSQNLSHDASCFVPSKSSLQTDEADENEFKTPVVSRKTSAAEPSGAHKTPDLGHFTRSVIQSLENIKFTPSQGVCTPSPTILVHHHHHVYGASTQGPLQDDQINSAYLAGLAAGRADAERKLTAVQPLIPSAMYETSSVQINNGAAGVENGGHGGDAGKEEDGADAGGRASVDGGFDDARSLDGQDSRDGTSEWESRGGLMRRKGAHGKENNTSTNSSVRGGSPDKARTRRENKASSSKIKSSSPINKPPKMPDTGGEPALHMAFALLSAFGVCPVSSVEEIPDEVLDLGSLLVTLQIPVDLIMTPANDFCGKGRVGMILNARQRRTLRRSQERAWKELEALKDGQAGDGNAQPVRRPYSPTCLNYGVNPGALAEYNGYVVAPHGLVAMPSPGVGHAYPGPVAYQMFGPGHPHMANFAPDHPRGYHHGHQYYGPGHAPGGHHGQQTRTLSRFAER